MSLGFPIQLIPNLCCTFDGTKLDFDQNYQTGDDNGFIDHGTLRCDICKAAYPIEDGILDMLKESVLDDESKHEQKLRNEVAVRSKNAPRSAEYQNEANSMEMIPTLEAMSISQNNNILELGCGDGRYTIPISSQCQHILAIDFSLDSLRNLRQRGQTTKNIGLVLGDITTIKVTTSFDRVLSTLLSNLPTREHRNSMYRLAVSALKPDGRFVFSAHNHGFRQKLQRETKWGRYKPGGIYRYNFTTGECRSEARPFFKVVDARPIQIFFPFARTLRLPSITLSRFLGRIPLINNLGELILCTAEQPILTPPKVKIAQRT